MTITGQRDGRAITATLSSSAWRVTVRPQLPDAVLKVYSEAKALIDAKQTERGVAGWRAAAEQVLANDALTGAWLFLRAGNALAEARRWAEAEAAFQMALKAAEPDDLAAARVRIWEARGATRFRQNDFVRAESAYHESRQLLETLEGESLDLASTLHTLGGLAFQRGDLVAAEPLLTRAASIKERLAPASLTLASTLNVMGVVAMNRGHLDEADSHYARSLAIRERVAPDSSAVAQSLDNLGNLARRRGDLLSAQRYLERALAIDERRSPNSLDVASSLSGLARVTRDRGELRRAEELYRKALEIRERLNPTGLDAAESFHNIGEVISQRGDLAAAEAFYRRALAIREKLAPGSLLLADTLHNLGTLAIKREDFTVARDLLERALAISEQRAPGSLDVAIALNNLGTVALAGGDLARARELKAQALAIRERLAPNSLVVAISLNELARLDASRGDLASAEESSERALGIQQRLAPGGLAVAETLSTRAGLAERAGDMKRALALRSEALGLFRKLAPGSIAQALTLHRLGALNRAAGQLKTSEDYFAAAIDTLETQMGTLGGAEDIRSSFAATHASVYRDYLDLLIDQKQHARAFEILERSRARSLLTMLGERDLLFTADLPQEMAREKKSIDADYDRTQARIGQLNPGTERAEIDTLLARLRQLRDARESVTQQIRKASPRFAALQYPQPLDLAGVQATLDPGTVLLSYAVGKERTTLFAVKSSPRTTAGAPQVATFDIPIAEEALRGQVTAFRRVIEQQSASAEPGSNRSRLREQGARLFKLLITPAQQMIAAADRVLIAPDGVLHSLPFAALIEDPEGPASQPRFFIEWKPLHTIVSVTVYEELKKMRREQAPADTLMVAFGDPHYPGSSARPVPPVATPDPGLGAVLRRGDGLPALPGTRAEVDAITRHYPNRVRSYLGADATEERAKAIGKDVRYVHFAAHGLLDERLPLNSALALSIPDVASEGQDNGLLQAWEIFEYLRIDADLVTLSACETALGQDMGGEGLVGLTRAFQYAGARSVMASLWSVADDSTAELMTRFYGYLKAGKSKDQALQAAQRDLVRSERFAQPFHWAAFTLAGDWR